MLFVRRVAAGAVIVVLAVGLTVMASVKFGSRFEPAAESAPVSGAGTDRVTGRNIARLQEHLRAEPKDADGWAGLGLAYVEQARVTADSSYYPKAAAAFDRSLSISPKDNEPALSGKGALAAARHDFAEALRLADQALKVNPYGTRAHAVRVDALVELGRYDEAEKSVRRADSLKPAVSIFTRYAYVMELRGRPDEAARVLRLAATSATDPADVSFVRTQLAELAWNRGDLRDAERDYAAALRTDPNWLPAIDGRARVRAALGDAAGAIRDRQALVGRAPLPSYVVALGELYEAQGMKAQAREQYAVAGAWATLARSNGVTTDLEGAITATDHGDRAAALVAARTEWNRRKSIHVADALAWALHANGQDKEALGYARQAARTGYRSATFRYHLGVIEKSLGRRADARRDLKAALALNPHFSDLHAPLARKALKELS
ncbi:tetratricopeptide repeat protein [Spirillospora sp. NPDC048911]|uniref:tetratricopeptide repeat protein n=1 Tax=Spirillospora sp. NPDC048911 TaxID=3364527 RepID=UPI0037114BDA